MNREQIDDAICDILMKDGPDGHVDGHDKITDFIMEQLAAERERSAKLADEFRVGTGNADFGRLAAAIRKGTP